MSPPLKATFRFVPIEPEVVAPPVARRDLGFDRPLAAGSVSAVIEVTWTAKTPVCVGEGKGGGDGSPGGPGGDILPTRVGGEYCLPGPTLRGMVRAVVEIATASHLGRINGHRHVGFRDFIGLAPNHRIEPLKDRVAAGEVQARSTLLKAGWLRLVDGQWFLYPARHGKGEGPLFRLVPIDGVLQYAGLAVAKADWLDLGVAAKYARLPDTLRFWTKPLVLYPPEKQAGPGVPKASLRRTGAGMAFQQSAFPSQKLLLVCGGRYAQEAGAGNPRNNEALFPPPIPGEDGRIAIPREWMQLFNQFHAEPGRNGGNPRGDWRDWLLTYGWQTAFPDFGPQLGREDVRPGAFGDPALGIPVFWKGTPDRTKAPGDQGFWFSLSRVMRVPFAASVGEVAQRLYGSGAYKVPRLDDPGGWDFARALFGEVDHANEAAGAAAAPGADRKWQDGTVAEEALKGRVAFGFAFAQDKPQPGKPETAVFGRPRESFWPFYLRKEGDPAKSVSYNSSDAVPAGRKRTHARRAPAPFPEPPNENRETRSTLRFLPAGTVFRGEVRAHNLHPVEFGALLWALTFGDLSGRLWHQAGRAKGFGYGALSPSVRLEAAPTVRNVVAPPSDMRGWIDEFEAYMTRALGGSFAETTAVRALRAMADPATTDPKERVAALQPATLKDYARYGNDVAKPAAQYDRAIEHPLRDLARR